MVSYTFINPPNNKRIYTKHEFGVGVVRLYIGEVEESNDHKGAPQWIVWYCCNRYARYGGTNTELTYMVFQSQTRATRIGAYLQQHPDRIIRTMGENEAFLAEFPETDVEIAEKEAVLAEIRRIDDEYKARQELTRRTIELMFPSLRRGEESDTPASPAVVENARFMASLFR